MRLCGNSFFETNRVWAMSRRLTAIIRREGDGYVAICQELDVASQGDTIEGARDNLHEALELFFECASRAEVQQHLADEVFVTQVEVVERI
jgi:predicted RNase H-like HicB family nuclease